MAKTKMQLEPKPDEQTETTAPTIGTDIVSKVLREVSDERKAVAIKVERLKRDRDARHRTLTESLEPLDATKKEAEEAVKGHARYKTHMPKAEWEKELTRLKKAEKKAKKAFDDKREAAMKDIAKITKPLSESEKRLGELAAEWKYHERMGRAAGLDMDEFWTPEDGVPEDDEDEEPEAEDEAAPAEE